MLKRIFRGTIFRVVSLAVVVAVLTSGAMVSVPSTRLSVSVGGFLSFEANVGVSVAEAASITTLVFHSGFEFGDFTEWDSIDGSPSVGRLVGVDQEYEDVGGISAGVVYGTQTFKAQTFTPGTNHTVKKVVLNLLRSGLPGTVSVHIQGVDGSAHPDNSDIASGTYDGDTISTSYEYVTFDLGAGVSLTASTQYAIVLKATSGDSSNYIQTRMDSISPTYSGGNYEFSNNGGSSWTANTGIDVIFVEGIDIPNTGDYSMRANPSGTTAFVTSSGVNNRISVWIYIVVAPDSDTAILGAPSSDYHIKLTTDRLIDLYTITTKRDDGVTQLDLDTWYRISFSSSATAAKAFIGGIEELSGTIGSASGMSIGIAESTSADIYFDDFVADNTQSTADLGDIRVLRAMPDGNGTYGQFDQTTGYTYVDDFPINDATYVEDNGSGAARDSYTVENTSDIGIGASDDIHAVNVWIRGNADGGGATDHMTMVRDDSSDYNSADHAFNGLAWFGWYTPDLPNGGGAWTVARFNAFQIGAYHSGGQDMRVMSVLVMVAYTPVSGEADISNSPSSIAFGTVATSTTYWSDGAEPSWPLTDADAYFTLTNNGDTCSITILATNFTGGVGWALGTPASNVVRLTVFEEGDGSGDGLVLTNSAQAFISGLVTNVDWELKMETPTIVTDGDAKSSTITLTATLD